MSSYNGLATFLTLLMIGNGDGVANNRLSQSKRSYGQYFWRRCSTAITGRLPSVTQLNTKKVDYMLSQLMKNEGNL